LPWRSNGVEWGLWPGSA